MINHLCLIMFIILCGVGAQDRCTTPQKKIGVCIDIRDCQPLVKILKQRPVSVESINYLISFHCGFNGNYSKVCCEAQNPVIDESKSSAISEPPNVTNHPNLSLLNHDICGPITEQKIFGGNTTGIFDYPWMALLFYDTGNLIPEFRCGGSLINKRYVLTAAHCVTSLPSELRLIGVRLGEHNFRTERDCEKEADELEVVCAEKYQDFDIEKTHFHPEFSRGKLQNDIALVRLNNDADFRPQNVRPICMPIGSAAILSQKKVTVTGWGTTELGLRSQELLQVHLSLVNIEKCAQVYKERKTQIWYKQICAGGKNGMDSCSGDSGGPLQAPGMYNNNLKYIQYGLVSFGPTKCGLEGVPAVYTNLVYYMDWILNTISA